MKKTLTAIAFVLFTAATASASPINFGFESGNLTGWSATLAGGAANVVTTFDDGNGPTYGPYEGTYFLAMTSGNVGVDQLVSQPFFMAAGETLYGATAFTTTDYLPYNDYASATIYGTDGAVVWSQNVAGVGDYGAQPWQKWSFTSTQNQIYLLAYSVTNVGDSIVPSYALFDAAVPDGGSALAMLGLGMIGLSAVRRKFNI
jgi:hypothetical protein